MDNIINLNKEIYECNIINQHITYYILESKYNNSIIINESISDKLNKAKDFIIRQVNKLVELIVEAGKKIRHFFLEYIPGKFKELKDKILKKKSGKSKEDNTTSNDQKEDTKSPESNKEDNKNKEQANTNQTEKDNNRKSKESEIHNDSNNGIDPTKMSDMIKTINIDEVYKLHNKVGKLFQEIVMDSIVGTFKLVYNPDLDSIYKYIDDFKRDYRKYEAKQKRIESAISEIDNELEKILNIEIYMKSDQLARICDRISYKKVDLSDISEAEQEAEEFKNEITNAMKDNKKEITNEICTALNNLLSEHTKVLKFRIELENTCVKEMNKIYSIMYKEISKAAK